MGLSEFKQGSVICSEGEPLRQIAFITNGSAEIFLNGQPFYLEKGDMIGLSDLCTGTHSHTYTAVSDVSIFTYPFDTFDALETLLRDNADAANLLINSMCRQISDLLRYRIALKKEASSAYDSANEIYAQYEGLCRKYAVSSKKLPELAGMSKYSEDDPVEEWVSNFYIGIRELNPAAHRGFFYGNPGIASGFLRRAAADKHLVYRACRGYQEYMKNISCVFLNNSEHDLFSLVAELHLNSINIKGADAAVEAVMTQLSGLLFYMTGVDPAYYLNRLNEYKEKLTARRASASDADAPADPVVKQNLSGSMDQIFEYADYPEETRNKFTRYVDEYRQLPDRGGSDDAARRVRKELTTLFHQLYQQVFLKSLDGPVPSTIIKMFLNFGYVDAALAGHENADFLYSIADTLKGNPGMGVYTLREWLAAIYNGKKEPNRNEFDMDYGEHLRELKSRGEIDAKEEARLLADKEGKLLYEIKNVFPIVNKLAFGRITTYCPLFSEHNVQRRLEMSQITPILLREAIDEIRSVDFSAYCREILYSNPEIGITNEMVHVEALPDVILMPTVGIRGVMWQEIEGRKRHTPARMFMPLFLETDLKPLITRLTAEFRWEMCKRIQGMRWNDITNPSLTSEFSDYLQFYKNNRELSTEVKETIKNELTRAKNNYKMVFVADYAEWLQYESNGSPRLNKNVLRMMMAYCPFSAPVRERLTQHPRYAELLTRYNNKQQQKAHRLTNVMQKIKSAGKTVPKEILKEVEFTKS
jgi:hypothetical protein